MFEFPFSIALEDDTTLLLEDGTTNTPNSSTEGKPFFESGASYATSSFDDKAIPNDLYANNVGIETVADGILDFSPFGGLQNTAGSGKNGDVLLTTTGHSSGDTYLIILHCTKDYE